MPAGKSAGARSGAGRAPRLRARPKRAALGWLLPATAVAGAALLVAGWRVREELYWTAEAGLGYGLGIAGTACMLLLLLYSLRKRLRPLRGAGGLRHWLQIHMALGILGPVAILLHANFSLGSLNSNVALFCVLTVSSSGVIGRSIYPKIHHGLSGRRASLRELRGDVASRRGALEAALGGDPEIERRSRELEALAAPRGFGESLASFLLVGRRARALRRAARRSLRRGASATGDGSASLREPGALRELDAYLTGARRVARFTVYERLFSLWHAFHLPLCLMLFAAAAVHVVAVHMY